MAYPTNPIYKETKDIEGNVNGVMKPGYVIPKVDDNTLWQEYLEWKAKGNTAEAAD